MFSCVLLLLKELMTQKEKPQEKKKEMEQTKKNARNKNKSQNINFLNYFFVLFCIFRFQDQLMSVSVVFFSRFHMDQFRHLVHFQDRTALVRCDCPVQPVDHIRPWFNRRPELFLDGVLLGDSTQLQLPMTSHCPHLILLPT